MIRVQRIVGYTFELMAMTQYPCASAVMCPSIQEFSLQWFDFSTSRHRMTEQEEDEELLADLHAAKKNIISFDSSPNYIKGGTMRDYQVNNIASSVLELHQITVTGPRVELDDWTLREWDQWNSG